MTKSTWNPWKLTALAMMLSIAVALVTGLVVANWTGSKPETETRAAPSAAPAPVRPKAPPRAVASATAPTVQAPAAAAPPAPTPTAQAPAAPAPGVPAQTAIDACNQQAASVAGQHDKT